MKKISKKLKDHYKKVKVKNPSMFAWLLFPVLILYVITNYYFEKPGKLVLGASTIQKESFSAKDSAPNIIRKFENFKWNGHGAVSIIFTGAFSEQYDIGYPDLNAKGFSASIAVPTNAIEQNGLMTWLNLGLLQFKGWEIISQSEDQVCDKTKLKDKNILESEINGSKEELVSSGFVVNLYLPPCGIVTTEVLRNVQNKYNGLLRFGIKANSINSINPYSLTVRQVNNTVKFEDVQVWIESARTNRMWLILSFPNIGDAEGLNYVNRDLLDKTLEAIEKSGLQVTVPGEILKYEKQK